MADLEELVRKVMDSAVTLDVPLLVSSHVVIHGMTRTLKIYRCYSFAFQVSSIFFY